MERNWPPKSHRMPVIFKLGNETTGILKNVVARISNYYQKMLEDTFFETRHCFDFDVSFYFPHHITSSEDLKVDNFLIMLNGLNEIHNYHFAHYDRIGAALAFRGLGVGLHPTPFHLNRIPYITADKREEYEKKGTQTWPKAPGTTDMKRHPSHSLMRDPTTLFFCFDQTAMELRDFALTIKQDPPTRSIDSAFYNHFIHKNATVDLLGYSMGGLQALYTFLRYPGNFHRCILINSGVNINQLNPKPVNIPKKEWDNMAKSAQKSFSKVAKNLSDPDLLNGVLFGFKDFNNAFKELSDRILFISGGADKVADARKLHDLKSKSGLNLIEIAGLSHPLHSPIFDRWFPLIINAIELFLTSPKDKSLPLSAEDILKRLMVFKIKGERWDKALRGVDQSSRYIDENHNLLLEEILEEISTPAEDFLKYYFMSKRYYQHDEELLRAIEREEKSYVPNGN